ncbi:MULTISPECIES: hypothetical protein [Actinoalloteichus]|uniref:Uncharacterized protein n=1 Tax=Actinoalloteichus fjordicus TaxID=1612552 RepID=A0AAC9PPT8_9PSEU|nr:MULTISPECIES: hypothetical protein [Actinoalloteichus]APU12202.1 hypothetical protein UA74_00515 [Actinoalloteichus fjordicus]APU18154.1 hypothetical protein UA75_00515 [Actinoalloteichus sp. GBA129-24]
MTDIDDLALAAARRRLGTTAVDETVNAALRLAGGLPRPDETQAVVGDVGSEAGRSPGRLAEDVLDPRAGTGP